MNRSNVDGDLMIVCGTPIPDDKGRADIPPQTAEKKVIEAGALFVEFDLEDNTPEVLAQLNAQQKAKQNGQTSPDNRGR